jgi:hypothetical protein
MIEHTNQELKAELLSLLPDELSLRKITEHFKGRYSPFEVKSAILVMMRTKELYLTKSLKVKWYAPTELNTLTACDEPIPKDILEKAVDELINRG